MRFDIINQDSFKIADAVNEYSQNFGPPAKKSHGERFSSLPKLKAHEAFPYGKPKSLKVCKNAGFCLGVEHAVKSTMSLDAGKQKSYLYGELIHNNIVVSFLKRKSWILANSIDEIEDGSLVVIRAHGISPQEEEKMRKKNLIIKDYTCPYVKAIHNIVRKAYLEGKQIIICGSLSHPEVYGINGECDFQALVVSSLEDCAKCTKILGFCQKTSILVSQTTFSVKKFEEIADFLKNKIAKLEIFGTICNATDTRQSESYDLASESDLMFVVGSIKSSNTLKLIETCRTVCKQTFLIESTGDLYDYLRTHSLRNKKVGITAAASSPESIIREVIQIMSEHEVLNQAKENLEQDVSFTEYLEQMPELRRGALVKGNIVRYDSEFVYLDIKDKSEGKVPLTEFTDPDFDLDKATSEHHLIEAVVRSVRNSDISKDILLSKSRADQAKSKKIIKEHFESKTPLSVKITTVVKDGVIANFGSLDIYIHKTQLDLKPVENLNDYKSKVLEVLITQFDDSNKRRIRVSASHRVLLAAERKEKAEQLWAGIAVGDIYEGTIRSMTNFGAFVDIGGVDGLIHVSELSWNRIKHPSEVVSVGDHVQVYVKDFDMDKKRISLGYKKIEDDPYYNIEERFPVGTVVSGKVMRIFAFGAFVEIAPNVDALCHISQISNVRITKPSEVLKEGMEVQAKVMEVSNEQRRVSISIKEVAPIDPVRETEEVSENPEEIPTEYIDDGSATA